MAARTTTILDAKINIELVDVRNNLKDIKSILTDFTGRRGLVTQLNGSIAALNRIASETPQKLNDTRQALVGLKTEAQGIQKAFGNISKVLDIIVEPTEADKRKLSQSIEDAIEKAVEKVSVKFDSGQARVTLQRALQERPFEIRIEADLTELRQQLRQVLGSVGRQAGTGITAEGRLATGAERAGRGAARKAQELAIQALKTVLDGAELSAENFDEALKQTIEEAKRLGATETDLENILDVLTRIAKLDIGQALGLKQVGGGAARQGFEALKRSADEFLGAFSDVGDDTQRFTIKAIAEFEKLEKGGVKSFSDLSERSQQEMTTLFNKLVFNSIIPDGNEAILRNFRDTFRKVFGVIAKTIADIINILGRGSSDFAGAAQNLFDPILDGARRLARELAGGSIFSDIVQAVQRQWTILIGDAQTAARKFGRAFEAIDFTLLLANLAAITKNFSRLLLTINVFLTVGSGGISLLTPIGQLSIALNGVLEVLSLVIKKLEQFSRIRDVKIAFSGFEGLRTPDLGIAGSLLPQDTINTLQSTRVILNQLGDEIETVGVKFGQALGQGELVVGFEKINLAIKKIDSGLSEAFRTSDIERFDRALDDALAGFSDLQSALSELGNQLPNSLARVSKEFFRLDNRFEQVKLTLDEMRKRGVDLETITDTADAAKEVADFSTKTLTVFDNFETELKNKNIFQALIDQAKRMSDILVGHSIIPGMVAAIGKSLSDIPKFAKAAFTGLVDAAKWASNKVLSKLNEILVASPELSRVYQQARTSAQEFGTAAAPVFEKVADSAEKVAKATGIVAGGTRRAGESIVEFGKRIAVGEKHVSDLVDIAQESRSKVENLIGDTANKVGKSVNALDELNSAVKGITDSAIKATPEFQAITREVQRLRKEAKAALQGDEIVDPNLEREIGRVTNNLNKLTEAAKQVKLDNIRAQAEEVQRTTDTAVTGIVGRAKQAFQGLRLAATGGDNALLGLRQAFFGVEESTNIVARGIDLLTGGFRDANRVQGALARGAADLAQTFSKQNQGIRASVQLLKEAADIAGVSKAEFGGLDAQVRAATRAFKLAEQAAESGGKGTTQAVRAQIEAANGLLTELELLRNRGLIPTGTVAEDIFNQLLVDIEKNGRATANLRGRMAALKEEAAKTAREGVGKLGNEGTRTRNIFTRLVGSVGKVGAAIAVLGTAAVTFGRVRLSIKQVEDTVQTTTNSIKEIITFLPNLAVGMLGIRRNANAAEEGVGGLARALRGFGGVIGRIGQIAGGVFAGNILSQALFRIQDAIEDFVIFLPAKLVQLASDSAESLNKFRVVFGDTSEQVKADIDRLASSIGRAPGALRNFAAAFQDTFVPLGFAREQSAELSKQLTALVSDVASFNNTADENVAKSFQSALVGNTEAVRKYGIVITQAALSQELQTLGIKGGIKAATEQEKVLARLSLILKGTVDAQGDALRTSGSFANQLRRLQGGVRGVGVAIGTQLLPAAAPFLQILNRIVEEVGPLVIERFTELAASIQDFAASVADAINSVLDGTVDLGNNLSTAIAAIVSLFHGDFAGAFNFLILSVDDTIMTITGSFQGFINDAFDFGFEFISQIADGVIDAAIEVLSGAVDFAAGIISDFFEPGSPPKEGPLSTIDKWGGGILDTFLTGFSDADFNILNNVLGPVTDALQTAFADDPDLSVAAIKDFRDGYVQVIDQINRTGKADTTFFENLLSSLGEGNDELKEFLRAQTQLAEAQNTVDKAAQKGFVPRELQRQVELSKLNLQFKRQDLDLAKEQQQAEERLTKAQRDKAKSKRKKPKKKSTPTKERLEEKLRLAKQKRDKLRREAEKTSAKKTAQEIFNEEKKLIDERFRLGLSTEKERVRQTLALEERLFNQRVGIDKKRAAERIKSLRAELKAFEDNLGDEYQKELDSIQERADLGLITEEEALKERLRLEEQFLDRRKGADKAAAAERIKTLRNTLEEIGSTSQKARFGLEDVLGDKNVFEEAANKAKDGGNRTGFNFSEAFRDSITKGVEDAKANIVQSFNTLIDDIVKTSRTRFSEIFSGGTVESSGGFFDTIGATIEKVVDKVKGFGTGLAISLPVITLVIYKIGELRAVAEATVSATEPFFEKLGVVLKRIGEAILPKVTSALSFVITNLRTLGVRVIPVVAEAITDGLGQALLRLARFALPIVGRISLIVGIITIIIFGIIDNLDLLAEIFDDTFARIGSLFSRFSTVVGNVFAILRSPPSDIGILGTILQIAFRPLIALFHGIIDVFQTIRQTVALLFQGVFEAVQGIIQLIIVPFDFAVGLLALLTGDAETAQESFLAVFNGLQDGVGNVIRGILDSIASIGLFVLDIQADVADTVLRAIGLDFVADKIQERSGFIREILTSAIQGFADVISGNINVDLLTLLGFDEDTIAFIKEIGQVLLDALNLESLNEAFAELGKAFGDLGQIDFTSIGSAISSLFGVIGDFLESAVFSQLREAFAELNTAIKELLAALGIDSITVLKVFAGIIGIVLVGSLTIFIGLVRAAVEGIRAFITGVTNVISGIAQQIRGWVNVISGAINLVRGILTGNGQLIQDSFDQMVGGTSDIISGAMTAILGIFQATLGTVLGLFTGFRDGVVEIVQNLFNILVGNSIFPDLADEMISIFENTFGVLGDIFEGGIDDLIGLIVKYVKDTVGRWKKWATDFIAIAEKVVPGISEAIRNLPTILRDIVVEALNGLFSLQTDFYNAGRDFINYLTDGLASAQQSVSNKVNDIAQGIFDYFDFGSPAKVGPLSNRIQWYSYFNDGLAEAGTGIIATTDQIAQGVANSFDNAPSFNILPSEVDLRARFGGVGSFDEQALKNLQTAQLRAVQKTEQTKTQLVATQEQARLALQQRLNKQRAALEQRFAGAERRAEARRQEEAAVGALLRKQRLAVQETALARATGEQRARIQAQIDADNRIRESIAASQAAAQKAQLETQTQQAIQAVQAQSVVLTEQKRRRDLAAFADKQARIETRNQQTADKVQQSLFSTQAVLNVVRGEEVATTQQTQQSVLDTITSTNNSISASGQNTATTVGNSFVASANAQISNLDVLENRWIAFFNNILVAANRVINALNRVSRAGRPSGGGGGGGRGAGFRGSSPFPRQIPGFQTGALSLSQDTMAMVHRGETILPQNVATIFRSLLRAVDQAGLSTINNLGVNRPNAQSPSTSNRNDNSRQFLFGPGALSFPNVRDGRDVDSFIDELDRRASLGELRGNVR